MRYWTTAEDRLLETCRGIGFKAACAKFPDRSKRAIKQRALKIGVTINTRVTASMRERARLLALRTIATTSGKGAGWRWLQEHVSHQGEECLLWPFGTARADTPRKQGSAGYGMLGYRGKVHKAGTLMCTIVNGPKPTPSHRAGYTCGKGNEGCVHPLHVKWMMPGEISAIAWRDPNRVQRPGTRFTIDAPEVAAIRSSPGTQISIARQFNLHPSHVGKIIRRESWVTGVRAKGGFVVGDPRNPSLRRALRSRPVIVLGAPAARIVPEFEFLEALLPRYACEQNRNDMRNNMIVALLEGSVTREQLIATRGAAFKTSFYDMNFDRYRYGGFSLDAPMPDGRSWHEVLTEDGGNSAIAA